MKIIIVGFSFHHWIAFHFLWLQNAILYLFNGYTGEMIEKKWESWDLQLINIKQIDNYKHFSLDFRKHGLDVHKRQNIEALIDTFPLWVNKHPSNCSNMHIRWCCSKHMEDIPEAIFKTYDYKLNLNTNWTK